MSKTPQKTPKGSASKSGAGFTFIDLFAGVGGFHQALHRAGASCVFASEWDEAARLTYRHNFRKTSPHLFEENDKYFNRDITEITQPEARLNRTELNLLIQDRIPEFDVLCAGFPCQPFSQAGFKRGFQDERGNLFYDIEKILIARRPRAFFLENVRHLLKHDEGRTIQEIRNRIKKAGYGDTFEFVVKASDHGLPQHRPRVFIVGFRDEISRGAFTPPEKRDLSLTMSDILGGVVTTSTGKPREVGFTLRVGGKQSAIDDRRNWDGYLVNGEVKRLQPEHGVLMQGFDQNFKFPDSVSKSDRMKQLGNSVAVNAIQDYADAIFKALRTSNG